MIISRKNPDRDLLLRGGGILLAKFVFIWGFVAALPWFNLFDTSPVYRFYRSCGPEWLWGIAAMAAAGGQWQALRVGQETLLRWSGLALTVFLLFSSLSFFLSEIHSVAGPCFLLFTLWEASLMDSAKANLAGSVQNTLARFSRKQRIRKSAHDE